MRTYFAHKLSLCRSIAAGLAHFFAFIAVGRFRLFLPSNKTQKNMCSFCIRFDFILNL